jgi:hypothetical protein
MRACAPEEEEEEESRKTVLPACLPGEVRATRGRGGYLYMFKVRIWVDGYTYLILSLVFRRRRRRWRECWERKGWEEIWWWCVRIGLLWEKDG